MTLIITFFLFILGLSFGSFISVIIERIHAGEKGIFLGHSKCPSCHHRLSTLDLIPLVSYIMLKGTCRYCKKNFSSHYFYLELFTAVVLTNLYFQHPFLIETGTGIIETSGAIALFFAAKSILSLIMIAIFFYDLKYLEIPNIFLYAFIGVALISSLILGEPTIISMLMALVISMIFFGGQILVSKGEWLGEGDLYIGLGMAILFGWQLLLVALIISYLIGGITASILLLTKKVQRKSKVPFAPFLVLGAFITMIAGNEILSSYLSYIWG